VSGVRIPSLTPLKPQVRRPGRDRGRAVQHDHRPSLGADLRIPAAHGGDFWEPILRPTLRGQPELLTGRWVKDPGAAGTLSSGPRICLIDRPPSQTAPRCHRPAQPGTQRRHRRSGPRRGDASRGSRCTQRLCWFRSRPTAKRHSGPRPCHRGRSSQGCLLRRVRAASVGVFSSHAKRRCSAGGIRAERKAGGMQIVLFGAPRYRYRRGARVGEAHRTRVALPVQSDCRNHLCGV
jgi:hypothetical protein